MIHYDKKGTEFSVPQLFLIQLRQLYKKFFIIILLLRKVILCGKFQCRLIITFFAASITFIMNNKALFGVGKGSCWAKRAAARVCPIPRENIHMERAKASRAMIPACFTERHYLKAAVYASKPVIVF